MQEYTLRSTYTRSESAARRAADVAVVLILSVLLVFLLFRLMLVPCSVKEPKLTGFEEGDLLLVDRVSKFVSDYSVGDAVRADVGGEYLFLRVAAAGGSTYTVRGGRAYLDGALLDESAYSDGWADWLDFEIEIPEGKLLLLPDTRTSVNFPSSYIVDYSAVYGEVRFRVSPLKKLAFYF